MTTDTPTHTDPGNGTGGAPSPSAASSLLERVQAMLLRPRQTWPVIAGEDDSIARVYRSHVVWLLLIPAVAGFIGMSLVGVGAFGFTVRVPILSGLVNMVVSYALSLAMVYVVALIANALAPRFGGAAHLPSAFKLVAYAATAALMGGVFQIVPMLSMLALLASAYSIYLLYLGVPVLMRVPQDRAVGYTAVLVVCAVVLGLVVGGLMSLFSPGGLGTGVAARQAPKEVRIRVPGTDIRVDTARVEEATRRMEAASKSGDAQEAVRSVQDMMGAAMGGQGARAPIATDDLRGFVPQELAGLPRTSFEAQSGGAMGMQLSSVSADYSKDQQRLKMEIQDLGASPVLVMGMAAWTMTTLDKETQTQVDRIYSKGGVAYKESYRKDVSRSEMAVLLPNKVLLTIGGNVAMDDLRGMLAQIDVGQLGRLSGQ